MSGRFEDYVAIVTGGSAGIGLATAQELAGEGARVALVGRNEARLRDAANQVAAQAYDSNPTDIVETLALDVRSEKDMAQMAERVIARFGKIDALVHSAGILRPPGSNITRFESLSASEWDEILDTNLRGTFLSNRAVLPHMYERSRGDIINLSSKSGRRGMAFDGPYSASKFGVLGLTEAIAAEAEEYGVRVQSLLPGVFQSDFLKQLGPIPTPSERPPVSRVVRLILAMLALPPDTKLWPPVIQPFYAKQDRGWIAGSGAGGGPAPEGEYWPGIPGVSLFLDILQ